ncbi:inorganic diphosphatase [bacterium]|nr:inorganic diphosphatase [bacterium]
MIKVFIQSEGGSYEKHKYNEKTLEYLTTVRLPLAYPYPYGFILDTTAADGDNLDCYVITDEPLKTGTIVECRPFGLLEQIEDGEDDHKILASLPGMKIDWDQDLLEELQDFIYGVFSQASESSVRVGRILSEEVALKVIQQSKIQKT